MNQVRKHPRQASVRHRQHGFTIIELTISMAFIAMLLLGIAMLTLQIGSIYNKGLTLRSVNESGLLVSNDIQRTLNSARPSNTLFVEDSSDPNQVTGGRLCGNNIVYAWSYGKSIKAFEDGQPVVLLNRYEDTDERIRLIRFTGSDTYCQRVDGVFPVLNSTTLSNVTNLLGTGDNNLVVTGFTINRDGGGVVGQAVSFDSTQRLYQVSITIGTGEDSVIQGSSCQNQGSRIDTEYCAVNQFNFTARAGAQEG
ncbi:MAG: prepilin-type N-terminal cleavage/methylation domain-containing protein [Patescibacteria group bacterium]